METVSHLSPRRSSNTISGHHQPSLNLPFSSQQQCHQNPLFRCRMGLLGAFALQFTLLLWFTASFASPLQAHRGRGPTTIHHIAHPVTRDLVVNEDTGTVVDSETERSVDQGSASDGAGSDFDVPAILWLSFGLVVGLYLTLAGMRLWKMTTAFATGLVFAVCGQSLFGDP